MPRVKKHTARQDIYRLGVRTPANNKQGYSLDRSQPKDENDTVIVKKGQEYYTWKFPHSVAQISLTYPRRQQLTQSDFLIQLYDLEDSLQDIEAKDMEELQSARDEIIEQINGLKDEVEERLSNMPDQLQSSPTGELLQERIDGLDSWANDLENVDLDDYNEPDDIDELSEDEINDSVQEWLEDKIQELQETSSGL